MVPVQDFVVLPLNELTLPSIFDAVLVERRLVDRVIHVQIESKGELQFAAYDNFDPDCVWCGPEIPERTIAEFLQKGIIKSADLFERAGSGMTGIVVVTAPPTIAGRLYPRYVEDAGILAVQSKVMRPWPFGVDIDGRIVFDLDADRTLANFDLHVAP